MVSKWQSKNWDFAGGSVVKNLLTNSGGVGLIPGPGRFPCRRKWQPTPIFLPGKSHGQKRLGHGVAKELDMI